MKKDDGYLIVGSCGCCAEFLTVRILGRYEMPDGEYILHLETVDEDKRTFWYDPRLDAGNIDA